METKGLNEMICLQNVKRGFSQKTALNPIPFFNMAWKAVS